MSKKKQHPFDLFHIKTPLLNRNWNLVFCNEVIDVFKEGKGWHNIFYELSKQEHGRSIDKTILFLEQTTACVIPLVKSNSIYMILPRDASPEMIAHEAFHLALMICDYKGMKLTDSSEEVYACLVEWIVGVVNEYREKI